MLRRFLALTAALAMTVGLAFAVVPTASAGCVINVLTGECTVTGSDPGEDGHHQGGQTGNIGDITCTYQGKVIPCVQDGYYWDAGHSCYPKPAPDWADSGVEGVDQHTGEQGGYYWCWPPGMYGPYIPIWFPGAPPQIDPGVVARELSATVGMRAIDVGIVPEDRAGSEGLVGMPVWAWNAAAGNPKTVGPLTAADQGVTITAKVDHVTWSWGDGSSIDCATMTPYQDSFGRQDSPDCGHRYTAAGHYAVSATSYWVIDWNGLGQTGQFRVDFTRPAQVDIAELQVLSQR